MDNNQTEASRWLAQAAVDLDAAAWAAQGGFYADACFKAQQAVEKALKALLFLQGERRVMGHATRELLQRVTRFYPQFSSLEATCRRLDKYYIAARYPDGLPGGIPHDYFDREEAEEAIQKARHALAMVQPIIQA